MNCPCCGAPNRSEIDAVIAQMPFAGIRLSILKLLADNFGQPVSVQLLADYVWNGTNFEPSDAAASLRAYVYTLRKAIRPYGLKITALPAWYGRAGYLLEWA